MIPRFSLCRWGGGSDDGLRDYAGWSLAIEWCGLLVELCWGRVRK